MNAVGKAIGGLLLVGTALVSPIDAQAAATPPALPTKTVSPLPPDNPGGRIIKVAAGADLQAALNGAKGNDTLVLEAGATWVGNFELPRRKDAGWVTIRSSLEKNLPPAGQRVSPEHAPAMPKVITPNASPAITARDGSQGWRLVGLEVSVVPTWKTVVYQLVLFGWGSGPWGRRTPTDAVASRFIVERCYIHGSQTQFVRRGLLANGADIRISDSWIDEIHDRGFDSQAILGYDGPGPYLIENNELQASSENIMFGGADSSGPDFFPSDIVIRRNHIIKPLRWKPNHPDHDGLPWVIKPLIELKFAQRVLIEGNILENSWGWPAFVFDAFGAKRDPWLAVQDVTFRYNHILNATCPWQGWAASAPIRRIALLHNVSAESIDPKAGNAYTRAAVGNFSSSKSFPIEDLWIEHNTVVKSVRGITIGGGSYMPRLTIKHNIFPYGPAVEGHWVWKDLNNSDPYWAVTRVAPDRDIARNALIGVQGRSNRVVYDPDEFGVWASAEAAAVNPDGTLQASSPLRRVSIDRKDIGADFDALETILSFPRRRQ